MYGELLRDFVGYLSLIAFEELAISKDNPIYGSIFYLLAFVAFTNLMPELDIF